MTLPCRVSGWAAALATAVVFVLATPAAHGDQLRAEGDHPPGQRDHPGGQRDHPPGQGDHPPGQGDHPSGQDDQQPGQDDQQPTQDNQQPTQDKHPPQQANRPPQPGDRPPAFTAGPTIEGQAVLGAEMRIAAAWSGVPAPAWLYEWDRCDASGLFCDVIDSPCGSTHVVTDHDVGDRLRAQVEMFNPAGVLAAGTPLSAVVTGGPPGPASAHETTTCAPSLPPASPAVGASGRLTYMRPFPTVRIRGYAVSGGASITLVTVRGDPSARIRVTCAGAGCPRRHQPPASPPARLRAFERFFPAGTVLQIRVTSGGTIGKYMSFRIRSHRTPRRADRCLLPGRWLPVRCPAP